MDRVQPPDPVQWVDIGSMHQSHAQYQYAPPAPISPPHPQDFGSYGVVESPGFPPPPSSPFRLQPAPVPIAPNFFSQWGQSMPPPASAVQTTSHHYSSPPAIAPAPAPTSAPQQLAAPLHTPAQTSSPRRTLTDDDRRRMCLYHEENPNVKQTEIGAMFGVERSTVSKVLRQKDKYLFPDDGNRSPVKRSKGKFPDIERALSVWARNMRKQGVALTDIMIRDKAKLFASSVGVSETQFKANGQGWLEKFKQKNNLHSNGRGRSESDATGLSRATVEAAVRTGARRPHHARTGSTPAVALAAAAAQHDADGDAHMMQHSKSSDGQYSSGMTSPEPYMDMGAYKTYSTHSGSPGACSWPGTVGDGETHRLGAGSASPGTPYYSENGSVVESAQPSPAFPSQQARSIHGHAIQQRPRSQTFPLIEYISPPASSEPLTPKLMNHPMMSSSGLASPSNPLVSPRHTPSSSHTMMSGQGTPEMGGHGGSSPSRDDARKALDTLMSYLKQQPLGFVEPDDMMLVGRLLGKFDLDGGPLETTDSNNSFHGSMHS